MTAPRTPEPEEPRPLSDHEQRAFSDLEARLVDGDPAPGGRLRRSAPQPASQPSRTLNAIIQAAVVGTVLVVVLPPQWGAVVVAIAFMAIPTALTLQAARRDRENR